MRLLLLIMGSLSLVACASTIQGTDSTGSPIIIKSGWGNRIDAPGLAVRPDENVIAAGERVAVVGMKLAPELVAQIVERRSDQ